MSYVDNYVINVTCFNFEFILNYKLRYTMLSKLADDDNGFDYLSKQPTKPILPPIRRLESIENKLEQSVEGNGLVSCLSIEKLKSVIECCVIGGKEIYFDSRFGNILDSNTLHQYYKDNCFKFEALPITEIVDIQRTGTVFNVCLTVQEEVQVMHVVHVRYHDSDKSFCCRSYDPTKIIPAILVNIDFSLFFIARQHPEYNIKNYPDYSKYEDPKTISTNLTNARKLLLGSRLKDSGDLVRQSKPKQILSIAETPATVPTNWYKEYLKHLYSINSTIPESVEYEIEYEDDHSHQKRNPSEPICSVKHVAQQSSMLSLPSVSEPDLPSADNSIWRNFTPGTIQEPESDVEDCNSCSGSHGGQSPTGFEVHSNPTKEELEEIELMFNSGVVDRCKTPVVDSDFMKKQLQQFEDEDEMLCSYRPPNYMEIYRRNLSIRSLTSTDDFVGGSVSTNHTSNLADVSLEDIYKASLSSDSENLKPVIPKIDPREDNLHDDATSYESIRAAALIAVAVCDRDQPNPLPPSDLESANTDDPTIEEIINLC